ncbi:MAG: ion transporter [Flavobacteriales bacterium]|nr:ion transporter [Flavobacteriales bacterium]
MDKKDLSTREKWREIIFESHTPDSRLFDVILLYAILLSVAVIMLDSVEKIDLRYGHILSVIEWFFTIIFTIEYVARIALSEDKRKYILSGWGIIDLVSTIPSYLSLFVHGPQYLLTIRILRLLRIFRVLRLNSYLKEARILGTALKASSAKIIVFFGVILSVVIVMGTLMYLIEGPAHGFTSIPRGIYWAIVTITTVGYGDLTPITVVGQMISSLLMLIGYAVITVPTGIVSVELAQHKPKGAVCTECGNRENDIDALFCKHCGHPME